MKKSLHWILGVIGFILAFLAGRLSQQPKINELEKHIELLEQDNSSLLSRINKTKNEYDELLIQHKGLRAWQLREKMINKERRTETLIMLYAIKAYYTLLLKRGRYRKALTADELTFFKAFEIVINGQKLLKDDMMNIRSYIMAHHADEINQSKECDFDSLFEELQITSH